MLSGDNLDTFYTLVPAASRDQSNFRNVCEFYIYIYILYIVNLCACDEKSIRRSQREI